MKYELQSRGLFYPLGQWQAEADARDYLSEAKADFKKLVDAQVSDGWKVNKRPRSQFATLTRGGNKYQIQIVLILE